MHGQLAQAVLRPGCCEPQVARGEALGGVWVLTGGAHDTSAVCIRDSELVRMSKVSLKLLPQIGFDMSPARQPSAPHNLLSKVFHALQGSFEVLAQQAPTAVAHILDGMARRLAAAATARSTAQCASPSLCHNQGMR
jgi:hypothetical protein